MALSDIHNYRQAAPDLATSGQPREDHLAAIAAAGYDLVINLALHDDPRYSLNDEASSVRALGMEYVHIPVHFGAPTTDDLALFFDAMDHAKGRRIWVHCAANMRVTAFLGLYWRLREGWPEERAFALMRDVWQPNEVWSSFIAARIGNASATLNDKSKGEMIMSTGTIRLHRVLRANPERVYRAFLDAAAKAKWLPPYGFTCTVHHMDAKVGGTYKMSFTNFTTGHSHSFGGEYRELVPFERIHYTDRFDDPNLPGEMRTTVTMKQVSCGTDLNIVQEGLPEAIPLEMCYLGWQESLAQLATLVEPEIPT